MAAKRKKTTKGEDRDSRGRFVKGCKGGPGNPFAKRTGELRKALHDAVSPDDLRELVTRTVEAAKGGDMVAARLVFDRLLGPPRPSTPLPAIELPTGGTFEDYAEGQARILAAVASGDVDAEQATALSSMLGRLRQARESAELESRIRDLEANSTAADGVRWPQ